MKILFKPLVIILFCFCWTDQLFSQHEIETKLQQFLRENQRSEAARTYVDLVRLFRIADPPKAIRYAFEGMEFIGDDQLYQKQLGDLYAGIGNTMEQQGFALKAIDFFEKAIGIYSSIDSSNHVAWRQLDIGTTLFNQKLYHTASQRYDLALDIFQNIKDLTGMAVAENNIALIFKKLGDPELAIAHFEQALEYRKQLGDPFLIGHSISYLGEINVQLQRYETALQYFEEANKILHQAADKKIIIDNFINMADLYQTMGKQDQAIVFLNRALTVATHENYAIEIPAIENTLGLMLADKKQFNSALKHLKNGLEFAQKNSDLKNQAKLFHTLHTVYSKQGDYVNALSMLKNHASIQDSLQVIASVDALTKMEITRILEENEQEINIQKQKVEKEKYTRNIISIILIFSFIGLVGLVNRYNYIKRSTSELRVRQETIHRQQLEIQKAKEQRLQDELEFKHKQLVQHTMDMARSQQLLSDISTEIKRIENPAQPSLKKVQNTIADHLHSEQNWAEFEKWFGEVYSEFFTKLKIRFPQISQREQKICALLKLKLSTKEIAQLTHLSPGSIEQYRIRIRKKFDLDRSANLLDFIDSI